MVAAFAGPCAAWDPIWCCDLNAASMAVTGTAVQAATEVLWQASAQRFGLCEVTLRPCRRDCHGATWPFGDTWWEWTGGGGPRPLLFDGAWFNIACGSCPGSCSCGPLEETVLPAPVNAVVQVKVDGAVLPSTAWSLHDGRILVRTDGGRWPACQDLTLADTQAGTWSVTARFGEAVPTLGRQAVGELACEMVRACLGEDCRLPANIASLVRQGVTITFPDSVDLVDRGYFGHLFLTTYNPRKLAGRPRVYDVDGPGFRRTNT